MNIDPNNLSRHVKAGHLIETLSPYQPWVAYRNRMLREIDKHLVNIMVGQRKGWFKVSRRKAQQLVHEPFGIDWIAAKNHEARHLYMDRLYLLGKFGLRIPVVSGLLRRAKTASVGTDMIITKEEEVFLLMLPRLLCYLENDSDNTD